MNEECVLCVRFLTSRVGVTVIKCCFIEVSNKSFSRFFKLAAPGIIFTPFVGVVTKFRYVWLRVKRPIGQHFPS